MDKVHLVLFTDLTGFVFTVSLFFSLEGGAVLAGFGTPKFLFLLLLHGFVNYVNTLLTFQVITKVTALTFSVLNVVKRIVTIVGSVAYFGNEVTTMNLVGIALAFSGVLMYSRLRHNVQNAKQNSKDLMPE